MQGGYEAQGMDNLPTYNEKEYVKTNGYSGYGCACMDVATDTAVPAVKRYSSNT